MKLELCAHPELDVEEDEEEEEEEEEEQELLWSERLQLDPELTELCCGEIELLIEFCRDVVVNEDLRLLLLLMLLFVNGDSSLRVRSIDGDLVIDLEL